MFLIFMLLGAFLNRHRGGLIPLQHGQIARLDYSLGLSLMLWWASNDLIMAFIAVPLFFLGSLAPNGAWMNVRSWWEVLQGSFSGLVNVGLAIAPMVFLSDIVWWPLLVAGLLKGPLYLLAQYTPDWDIKQFHRGPEIGEALFGLALGLGIWLA